MGVSENAVYGILRAIHGNFEGKIIKNHWEWWVPHRPTKHDDYLFDAEHGMMSAKNLYFSGS